MPQRTMTFKDWKNTQDGEKSLAAALACVDDNSGVYVDDLVWLDYKSSEYWQSDQGQPKIMGVVKKPEDLNLLTSVIKKLAEETLQNINDLQLKDAKATLTSIVDRLDGYDEIADGLNSKGITQR